MTPENHHRQSVWLPLNAVNKDMVMPQQGPAHVGLAKFSLSGLAWSGLAGLAWSGLALTWGIIKISFDACPIVVSCWAVAE